MKRQQIDQIYLAWSFYAQMSAMTPERFLQIVLDEESIIFYLDPILFILVFVNRTPIVSFTSLVHSPATEWSCVPRSSFSLLQSSQLKFIQPITARKSA